MYAWDDNRGRCVCWWLDYWSVWGTVELLTSFSSCVIDVDAEG